MPESGSEHGAPSPNVPKIDSDRPSEVTKALNFIRSPQFQEFVTTPETPMDDLIGFYAEVVPNTFTVHQFRRTMEPEMYRRIVQEHEFDEEFGPLQDTFHDAWDRSWRSRIEQARANPHDSRSVDILNSFNTLRPAFLKLNEIIVNGDDPAGFDWENWPEDQNR